jgi:hypothetical protein
VPRFLYKMLLHWEKSTIVGRKLQSIWTLDCSASYKVLLPETLPAAALEVPTMCWGAAAQPALRSPTGSQTLAHVHELHIRDERTVQLQ